LELPTIICFGTVNSYDHTSGIGTLRIIARQNGEIVNRYMPNSNILSSPVFVDGKIIFGTSKGEVISLNSILLFDDPTVNIAMDDE